MHETFCRVWPKAKLQGLSAGKAFVMAGGRARSDNSAGAAASRLLAREDIQRRLQELGAYAVSRAQIDADNLLSKAERVYHEAVDAQEFNAANQAMQLQGRITGLDRITIDQNITLTDASSVNDVLDHFIADLGGGDLGATLAFLDQLRADLIERASARAKVINGGLNGHGADSKIPTNEKAE
ncbi:hypothetical protein ACQR2B_30985 [Bradyrhizobium oligotrophicum]|uniref:hypothetical protein n=1 Tax=Bradyrhizobium TaxID=374 RepID=UPI003EC14747